jgi:HNH endonuclease
MAAIGQRLRFEVFKRDKFTCQYCGQQAPDVILNCDHIQAVADGGETDLLNLVTSCRACNGGKGAVALTDASALNRQRSTLADLEERRQQIEMMLQWRDDLRDTVRSTVDEIGDRIAERAGWGIPTDKTKADITRWMRRFSIQELLEAIDHSCDLHLRFVDDKATQESIDKALRSIPAVVSMQRQAREKPYIPRLLYIQGIIRKRTGARRYSCVGYLEHVHLCGGDLDRMEEIAKCIRTIDEFEAEFDGWLESIGRPF